jgi:hypothetical protein
MEMFKFSLLQLYIIKLGFNELITLFLAAEIVDRRFFAFSYFHDIAIALGLVGK